MVAGRWERDAGRMQQPVIAAVDPIREDRAPAALGLMLARLTWGPLLLAGAHTPSTCTSTVSIQSSPGALREDAEAAMRRLGTLVERPAPGAASPLRPDRPVRRLSRARAARPRRTGGREPGRRRLVSARTPWAVSCPVPSPTACSTAPLSSRGGTGRLLVRGCRRRAAADRRRVHGHARRPRGPRERMHAGCPRARARARADGVRRPWTRC